MLDNTKDLLIVVPTYNPGVKWAEFVGALLLQEIHSARLVIIDSSSTDGSLDEQLLLKKLKEKYELFVEIIPASEFNHGGTRNYAVNKYGGGCRYAIYLTQDALLVGEDSLSNLLGYIKSDPQLGAVCGRQIPHDDANLFAKHARYFNYPSVSSVKTKESIVDLGIKVAFLSNSYAIYDIALLSKVGGFPVDTILCEDMYVAGKLILAGKKVGYSSESVVKHSHNYSPKEEFKRYFDIGVFHSNESWIMCEFGGAAGEGFKFAISELRYLWKNGKVLVALSPIYTVAKYAGLKLGGKYKMLPTWLLRRLSMHRRFWK